MVSDIVTRVETPYRRSIIINCGALPTFTSKPPAKIWRAWRTRIDANWWRKDDDSALAWPGHAARHGSGHARLLSRASGWDWCLSVVLLFLVISGAISILSGPGVDPAGVATRADGSVLLTLLAYRHTTLNVMSLMGIVMMVGISVSDSILIVEFTNRLRAEGMPVIEAVRTAARVRLRPVLMTTIATLIGLLPMALKLGEGSESLCAAGAGAVWGRVSCPCC